MREKILEWQTIIVVVATRIENNDKIYVRLFRGKII